MPIYKSKVTELRAYECFYTIEADTYEEAQRKADSGDTLAEHECRCIGVTDRQVSETYIIAKRGDLKIDGPATQTP